MHIEQNPSKFIIIVVTAIYILSRMGEMITGPLFIDSFKDSSTKQVDPYFVIIFTLICLIMSCVIISIKNIRSLWMNTKILHIKMLCIALFWTSSFTLTTFGSSESRTPVDLQAILYQAGFPLTFLLRMIILKYKPPKHKIIGALIITTGITISIIPMIISLGNESIGASYMLWSLAFLLGIFFGAACNIFQEIITKHEKISTMQFMFWGNTYQLILTVLLFWINIIPNFGLSTTLLEWSIGFSNSFSCFFGGCPTTWYLGFLNIISGLIVSISAFNLIKYVDANYKSTIGSIVTPLTITFWAFYKDIPSLRIWLDYLGAFIIVIGFCYSYLKKEIASEQIFELEKYLVNDATEDNAYVLIKTPNNNSNGL